MLGRIAKACICIAILTIVLPLAVGAAKTSGVTFPTLHQTQRCSNTVVGKLPCSWSAGVNLYPGGSDSFYHKDTTTIVKRLITQSHFNSVTIDVPVYAANFTDAHVRMPAAGHYEVYACARHGKSSAATYYSPSAEQVKEIGEAVLRANPNATVIVRPMLALGGSCKTSEYYPTGKYLGSGFSHDKDNEAAFAHFYTSVVKRLAADSAAIGHRGHVMLDDASELSCLFDDPLNAGYRSYFASLTNMISAHYPHLPQMYSVNWNFADSSDAGCGWPGTITNQHVYNEAKRDIGFLRNVAVVGIDENFPLNRSSRTDVNSAAALYERWQTSSLKVAGKQRSAAALVQMLDHATGREVVISAIGYVDCSLNPGYRSGVPPKGCNSRLSAHRQKPPSRAQLVAEQNAVRAAYCYWTQSYGANDPWFLGLWWWDRDFDTTPYVNPFDISWGQSTYGISALKTIKDWQRGDGSCAGVGGVTVTSAPKDVSSTVGVPVRVQISGHDLAPDGHLVYSAAGLPDGLSIDKSTGLISGTPANATVNAAAQIEVRDAHGGPSQTVVIDWSVVS